MLFTPKLNTTYTRTNPYTLAIMDAHSVSFTSAAERSTSRIWKDLNAYHQVEIVDPLEDDEMSASADTTAKIGKVHLTDCKLEGFNLWGRVGGPGLRLNGPDPNLAQPS